jgi:hypothetical protein
VQKDRSTREWSSDIGTDSVHFQRVYVCLLVYGEIVAIKISYWINGRRHEPKAAKRRRLFFFAFLFHPADLVLDDFLDSLYHRGHDSGFVDGLHGLSESEDRAGAVLAARDADIGA